METYGDLKNLINLIKTKKKNSKIKGVALDVILGNIPGIGYVKSAFDFYKAAIKTPDNKRPNSWLKRLDVDDEMSAIVDDKVENGFLQSATKTFEKQPDDKKLNPDFDMNQEMIKYLDSKYSGRTLTGVPSFDLVKEDVLDKFLKQYSYKFNKGYPDMNDEQDILLMESILKELNIDLTLKESALSPTELNKPYTSRHELAGQYEDRGERFLEKIIKKQEFELNDGSKIIIDVEKSAEAIKNLKDKKYNAFGRGSKILIDTKGNTYSLSSFKKTSEFGSGKGMGGGAASTAIQESSQSVVNAIAYNVKKGQLSEEDLTEENIKEAFKFSDISSSLEEVLDFIKNQPSWTNTFISTANVLLSNFSNSSFQQHRGSSFVDSIYEAYKAAKKGAGISMQADKWNPADIWMVDVSILSTQFPTELKELNALLVDLYAENKLIGVSLKKTGKEAKIGTYNLSEEDKEGYTYTNSDSKPTNNSVSIVYSDGVITFRTFNFASNFAGEIKGKTASHGKIGQGAINDVLRENNLPLLPSPKDLQSKFKSKDEDLIEDFYSNYNKVVEGISKKEFDIIVDSKDLNWLISKYMSTKLASTIETQDQSTQDEIISDMIRYASSATKSSSVFAKVS